MKDEVYNFSTYANLMGCSQETIRKHKYYITIFLLYIAKIGVSTIEDIQNEHIRMFKKYLLKYKNNPTVYKAICTVRSYMRYRYKMSLPHVNPVRIENIDNPYKMSRYMRPIYR